VLHKKTFIALAAAVALGCVPMATSALAAGHPGNGHGGGGGQTFAGHATGGHAMGGHAMGGTARGGYGSAGYARGGRVVVRSSGDYYGGGQTIMMMAAASPIGSAAVSADSHRGRRAVQAELCRAADDKQPRQLLACAKDAALYRPNRHATDCRRLVIGEARRCDQKQRLTVKVWQFRKRLYELLEFQAAELLSGRFQAGQVAAIRIFYFAAALVIFRPESVTQDGEKPRRHVRPRCELLMISHVNEAKSLQEGLGYYCPGGGNIIDTDQTSFLTVGDANCTFNTISPR
jgi:hypothetical protein